MSGWFGPGKQNIAGAGNVLTAVLKAVVIDEADYTYARTHADLTAVPVAAREGTPVTLATVTVNAAGEIDCDDFTITGLTAGLDTAEAILVYIETAAADASRIPLLYINGLSIIPNGGNYTFQVQSTSPFLGRF
jgi:hypothetical protein